MHSISRRKEHLTSLGQTDAVSYLDTTTSQWQSSKHGIRPSTLRLPIALSRQVTVTALTERPKVSTILNDPPAGK